MMTDTATAAPPTCSARTGELPGDYGMTPAWCNARIGLRSVIDRHGIRRHYCPASGHRTAVIGRYGQATFEGMDDDWDTRKATIDAAVMADPDRP